MNIHEYQAKELFRKYGIPVPRGVPCRSVDEVGPAADALGGRVCVVKAQIHAGGRGKAGGVRIAKSRAEAVEHGRALLGSTLVTHQTGPAGKEVRQLLVEEGLDIAKEYYAALAVDRRVGGPVVIASAEGGVDIESVPQEKLLKEAVDPYEGLRPFQARALAYGLGFKGDAAKQAADLFGKLVRLFLDLDCSLAEINPLVQLKDGRVLALDAKVNFDDNALFRHPSLKELRDPHEEDPAEARAAKHNLSYVNLDGSIGCMVNGAGLAMATMDIIKLYGSPAVKAILVNIVGGIVKCDVSAAGILGAVKAAKLELPLIVRLEGTNVDRGRKLLKESGLEIRTAADMTEAARKAVEAAR